MPIRLLTRPRSPLAPAATARHTAADRSARKADHNDRPFACCGSRRRSSSAIRRCAPNGQSSVALRVRTQWPAERGGCARLETRLRWRPNARRRRPPRRAKHRRDDVEPRCDAEPHDARCGPSVDPSTLRTHESAADPRLETRASTARSPPTRVSKRARRASFRGRSAPADSDFRPRPPAPAAT